LLFERRQEACDDPREPSQEHFRGGVGGGLQSGLLPAGCNKPVDLCARPAFAGERHRRVADRLERPELPPGSQINAGTTGTRGTTIARIDGAGFDPSAEVGDHRIRQTSVRRHLDCFVPQRSQQFAGGRIPRHHSRTGVSAEQQSLPGIHEQSTADVL